MTRRILILSLVTMITAYLIASVTFFNSKPNQQACQGMELSIKDSINYQLITTNEVKWILEKAKIRPIGQNIRDINTRNIEEILSKNPFIQEAECYITSGGKIAIGIKQRLPVIRILSNNGDNYYIDSNGEIMSAPNKAVHVPIASGFIERKFAQTELYQLGMFLHNNRFWSAQIEQINVTPNHELELAPRIGNHLLFLGKPGNYNEKFSKLQTFYKEALNQVGWNKYSRISVEFNNQIICTKKEK